MVTRRPGPGGHEGVFARSAGRGRARPRVSVAYGTMARMRDSERPWSGEPTELPAYAERVLEAAEQVPPGRVMTYGDVAEWLGDGGPRQVGRAMALYGGAVPWWRVVRADGRLLPGHEQQALERYREEGTPLRPASAAAHGSLPRVDLGRARWPDDGGTYA
jgi:alkylated DNA nucleotide flippase Atl1